MFSEVKFLFDDEISRYLESTGEIKYHAKAAKIKDSEGVLNFRLFFDHFRMESCSVK